jgi:hypothetical protein
MMNLYSIYFVVLLDSMMDNFVNTTTMSYNYYMDIVVVFVGNNFVLLQMIVIEIEECKAFLWYVRI